MRLPPISPIGTAGIIDSFLQAFPQAPELAARRNPSSFLSASNGGFLFGLLYSLAPPSVRPWWTCFFIRNPSVARLSPRLFVRHRDSSRMAHNMRKLPRSTPKTALHGSLRPLEEKSSHAVDPQRLAELVLTSNLRDEAARLVGTLA